MECGHNGGRSVNVGHVVKVGFKYINMKPCIMECRRLPLASILVIGNLRRRSSPRRKKSLERFNKHQFTIWVNGSGFGCMC